MKKNGILNAKLAGLVAGLGHFDTIVLADAGLPMPKDVDIVDLAITGGLPSFQSVLEVLLSEICVESYTIASEMEQQPHDVLANMKKLFPANVPMEAVPQTRFNELAKQAKFVVRTGEFSHYSNVIIQCGCAF